MLREMVEIRDRTRQLSERYLRIVWLWWNLDFIIDLQCKSPPLVGEVKLNRWFRFWELPTPTGVV